MAGESAGSNMTKNQLIELNNNGRSTKINDLRKSSVVSVSGVGRGLSDFGTVQFPSRFVRQHSLQELFPSNNKEDNKIIAFQRGRSNSDGAAIALGDNAEAFPNLPNSVLEKMGLHGDGSRERLSEESLEQKFTSLALAFTIDAATIKNRCERQKRTRDQTESNLNLEVEKLKEKLALLQPLCTDFESAELLSILFSQVDVLTKAASLVSISAERFGAVQHEERLTESVQLMVNYVQALKQQRDSARRQLQYTKRVLQEPIQPEPDLANGQKSFATHGKKIVTKRRASTDSVNPSQQEQNIKLNRRISDLSFRATLAKNGRPSRLDLGMELKKIREIALDDQSKETSYKKPADEPGDIETKEDGFDDDSKPNLIVPPEAEDEKIINKINNVIKQKFYSYAEDLREMLTAFVTKRSEKGYLHAFLSSCAVLCFSVSILTLVSIFMQQEYVNELSSWLAPWSRRKS